MDTVLSSLEPGLFEQETFCYIFFFFLSWLPFLLSICVFLTLQVHSSVKLICLLSYLRGSYQTFAVDYLPPIRNLQVYEGGNWAQLCFKQQIRFTCCRCREGKWEHLGVAGPGKDT